MYHKSKREALRRARAARALLNQPRKWKIEVRGNQPSFYFKLTSGPLSLYQGGDQKFHCLLSEDINEPLGGSYAWNQTFHHHNPNRVIAYQLQLAADYAEKIKGVVEYVKGVL